MKKPVVMLLAVFIICSILGEARADEVPVLTLELAIVHGKLSTPREKREVSKARLDVPLDEKERKIELKFSNPYSTTSSASQQTYYIENATPSFTITARPAPGGAEAAVRARYKVSASLSEAYAVGGVSPKTGIRGLKLKHGSRCLRKRARASKSGRSKTP